MSVDSISAIGVNPADELNGSGDARIDPASLAHCARTLEEAGFDPFGAGATVVAHTQRIEPIIALSPPETERHARQAEHLEILRRVWTCREAFDQAGTSSSFSDFECLVRAGDTAPVHVDGGYPAWKDAVFTTTPGGEDAA